MRIPFPQKYSLFYACKNGNYDNATYIEKIKGTLSKWDYSQHNIKVSRIRDNVESIFVALKFNEIISLPNIIKVDYIYID